VGAKRFLGDGEIEPLLDAHRTLIGLSRAGNVNNLMHRSWIRATMRLVRVEPLSDLGWHARRLCDGCGFDRLPSGLVPLEAKLHG